jgi:hypothetical protein
VLSELSNTDKHRRLHLTYIGHKTGEISIPNFDVFRDCRLRSGMGEDALLQDILLTNPGEPRPNQEIVRLYVTPAGPNPEVDIYPRYTGDIVFEKGWPMVETLEAMYGQIALLLNAFDR